MFTYKNLHNRMSERPTVGVSKPMTEDDFIYGVKPLSDQIRSYRSGGLKMGTRELSDSSYDEDDFTDFDPSSEFGKDRFEKVDKISSMISDRMAKKHKKKIEEANPQ